MTSRPVTSLGYQGGEEFSERGPNFLNYVQHIFSGGAKNFARGRSPPGYGSDDSYFDVADSIGRSLCGSELHSSVHRHSLHAH